MRGSPFFDGIRQADIEIAGQPAKVPVFYYDASEMVGLFPARLGALRELLPDPRLEPARLAPGLGVVVVACLEYRDTDIGPYNELGVMVPLNVPYFRPNRPGARLMEARRTGQTHAFVLHLPVTTEIALRGGVDYYNFPKFVASIDFDVVGDRRRCRLAEGKEHILTMTGDRPPATKAARSHVFCHLWMDGQPQLADVAFNELEVARTLRPGAAVLELGERHPIARELGRLLVSRRSLQYTYVPRLELILHGPEHLTVSLIDRFRLMQERAATAVG